MSKQGFETFRTQVAENQALRTEMTRTLTEHGTKSVASAQELAEFARSRGYDVAPEDVRAMVELSDEQLDAVSGGTRSGFTVDSENHTLKLEEVTIVYETIQRVSG